MTYLYSLLTKVALNPYKDIILRNNLLNSKNRTGIYFPPYRNPDFMVKKSSPGTFMGGLHRDQDQYEVPEVG